ncbi:pectate lyase superfamily protein-domain-containing protein [Bombardia bombarda]|uniref:Pectate lyase superfamily protein-domain-containing protein n=1 Tax=Bombardia bombarda TaxID=252184 RepID=A0AA39U736_9PEZI|nr:pectate lyase superfamily protein-domain-containing protein [Bombardia bombarda]
MKAALAFLLAAATAVRATYWMEAVRHQGNVPSNPDKNYQIFRNVKDWGARGDGITDDTDAINNAMSAGDRCGGVNSTCQGSTITPAVLYFPAGTYLISNPIVDYYYTQIIGDPNGMPVIKGSPYFPSKAPGLLNGDVYQYQYLGFRSTNVFYRQVRNIIFDTTDVPGEVIGIHWPSAQATSIQNCVFQLSSRPEDNHTGIFMEEGSGGVLADLVFNGGQYGAQFGNQQYTMRNLTFNGARTAILQIWNWGWTYKSLSINNCDVGINMSSTSVGSVTLLDSQFINVGVAMVTGRNGGNTTGVGSLVVENVLYQNVPTVLQGPDGSSILLGNPSGPVFDRGYTRGNLYVPYGPKLFEGRDSSYFNQPPNLKGSANKYYERPKPQYETQLLTNIRSARDAGAYGDGFTDDTDALNRYFQSVASDESSVGFVDAGFYLVTDTIYIPSGARIVGEALAAVIMASGPKFSNINTPYPVVQVGKPGETGHIEMSDIIVSTAGATPGAVLIQYNLNSPFSDTTNSTHVKSVPPSDLLPSGLWDVHIRIGGFIGSGLQVAQCPTTPLQTNYVNPNCIAAHTSMHITKTAGSLYVENSWLWTADHDIDDWNSTQVSVFAGRGLLIEGSQIWLVGSAVEHHALYQYQLVNASDVWMGQIQTETPYYQPDPPAPAPFYQPNTDMADPVFVENGCQETNNDLAPCAMAWGLRILDSRNVVIFGAGLYSFFNNYSTNCSTIESGENCQARIFLAASMAGGATGAGDMSGIVAYNLNTVGSVSMVTRLGDDVAMWDQTPATFASTLAVFQF